MEELEMLENQLLILEFKDRFSNEDRDLQRELQEKIRALKEQLNERN